MRSLLLVCLFSACATEADLVDDEIEVSPEDDGKADSDSELRVRTGETSVWVDKALALRADTPNGPALVLRGRASRSITDGMGFVFDDPYGDFATAGSRTFEVTFPISTARTLVDGVNQFVRIGFTHSNGRPDSLTARVVVRPRMSSFSGSSGIYLTAELAPVVVGGTVVYRAHGKTTAANNRIGVSAGDLSLTDVRRLDDNRFEFDLAPDVALALLGTGKLAITADLADGGTITKTAKLGVAIKKLGLTAGDAYEKWPRPDCDTATRSCLTALPDGSVDLAACGEAVAVLSCAGRVGVFADDVAMQAALAEGNARTATTAFRSDAKALVGADRVEQLAGGAEQTIDDRVTRLFGRWYLSATARDAALRGAVDAAMLSVYTRPLDLVEPHEPKLGDLAATRQVAADALLAELATSDFIHTEFDRSYDQLVTELRAIHVESIRKFREVHVLEPYSGHPEWDVIVGDWLGTYVEVTIDHATGAAVHTLIEID